MYCHMILAFMFHNEGSKRLVRPTCGDTERVATTPISENISQIPSLRNETSCKAVVVFVLASQPFVVYYQIQIKYISIGY